MLRLEGGLAATEVNYRLWQESDRGLGGQEGAGLGRGGSEGKEGGKAVIPR